MNRLDIVFVNRRIASPTVLPRWRFFGGKYPRKILVRFVGRFNTLLLFRWAKYHLFSSCNHLAGSALVCNVPFGVQDDDIVCIDETLDCLCQYFLDLVSIYRFAYQHEWPR